MLVLTLLTLGSRAAFIPILYASVLVHNTTPLTTDYATVSLPNDEETDEHHDGDDVPFATCHLGS